VNALIVTKRGRKECIMVECIYGIYNPRSRLIMCIHDSECNKVTEKECEKCPYRNDFTRKGEND
jgi:hypothetical protein